VGFRPGYGNVNQPGVRGGDPVPVSAPPCTEYRTKTDYLHSSTSTPEGDNKNTYFISSDNDTVLQCDVVDSCYDVGIMASARIPPDVLLLYSLIRTIQHQNPP
jgi:hypothetical protein